MLAPQNNETTNMHNSKKKIAVFDFDGTLTTRDTLLEFIRWNVGTMRFIIGLMLFSPLLIMMKLHLYPNWKAKEKFIAYYMKGMSYDAFKHLGELFATRIETMQRKETIDKLKQHLASGDKVFVISASVEEWVAPFCHSLGDVTVLATHISHDLKHFTSRNCYGQEKVNRLTKAMPDIMEKRDQYYIYAYGDSRGDKEMLAFADEPTLIRGVQ